MRHNLNNCYSNNYSITFKVEYENLEINSYTLAGQMMPFLHVLVGISTTFSDLQHFYHFLCFDMPQKWYFSLSTLLLINYICSWKKKRKSFSSFMEIIFIKSLLKLVVSMQTKCKTFCSQTIFKSPSKILNLLFDH